MRAIAKNGNLGATALCGAAVHQTIRGRAEHAGYDHTALAKLGGHSLRAGFVAQGTRNGAGGSAIARQTRTRQPRLRWRTTVANMHHSSGNAVNEIGL